MTRKELVERVAKKLDIDEKEAAEAVSLIIDMLSESIAAGHKAQFRGFGSFYSTSYKRQLCRLPLLEKPFFKYNTKHARFKASKKLKKRIND